MNFLFFINNYPATASTHLYNFESNSWSTGPELPAASAQMGSVSANGDTLVLAGGALPNGEISDKIFEYSGPSNTWYTWPETMEQGRINPTAVLVEQRERNQEDESAAGGEQLIWEEQFRSNSI